MESEEGSDDNGVGDYGSQNISEDSAEIETNKETHTTSKCLEDIQHEALLALQNIAQCTPGSTSQILDDHPKLLEAIAQLKGEAKRGDLDVIVQARITAMIGLLNIHTDNNFRYSWRTASEIMAKTLGHRTNHVQHIRKWMMDFLKWRDLPLHQFNWKHLTILDDEDLAEEIKTCMMKGASLKAKDIVEIVASPQLQAIFAQKGITKASISVKTALQWLEKLGWTYRKLKNRMYLDGHKRSDVVEYRQSFVEHWMGHEQRFHQWDHDGTELPCPNGFPVPGAIGRFRLILVMHNESTFFQNDEHDTGWSHATSKAKPKAKGNGQTLMVSDFLTPDWGCLHDGDE